MRGLGGAVEGQWQESASTERRKAPPTREPKLGPGQGGRCRRC
jgi:hypothetical protein